MADRRHILKGSLYFKNNSYFISSGFLTSLSTRSLYLCKDVLMYVCTWSVLTIPPFSSPAVCVCVCVCVYVCVEGEWGVGRASPELLAWLWHLLTVQF